MEVANTFTVNHDADKVYAFLVDHEYQTKWVPNLVSVSPLEGGVATKGATHTMVIKEMNKYTEYFVTVLEAMPGKLVKLKMEGWGCGKPIQRGTPPKLVMFAAYALRPNGRSTDITMTYGMDMSKASFFEKLMVPLGKLISKVFMGKFRKAIIRELERYEVKRA